MHHLDAHPAVGMVGCHLEDERGLQEASYRGFPTLWRAFCELFLLDHASYPRPFRGAGGRVWAWGDRVLVLGPHLAWILAAR